ncbi:exonuclease domain-containing protein [Aromatoleum bremense]|uniref:DNA-directed DNA polymerase n=1 Tax=Aromatoleum bremense TaxID=76115 RepID=A0ABX1NSD9_9RHOO|nr:exonuclease domain-containing protein [Aromatoleum bremense]NMG14884.1 ethanolamine utilization protein [Aromatoleum bremense]QTQ32109.1 putative excinuclease [Aromatoleum bremense]
MSLPDSLVLIDVETTGANPVSDRVTEIAVLRIERGEIVARWESLVNPERPIPSLIQRLVGITDEMVAAAPTFAELADSVRGHLDGAVFVAHNARFDYGFIRNEFSRLGQQFEASVLCTVKLSRALYPQHHRHGLDALIERHGFTCGARHRAMGDTDVLWQFARLVSGSFSADVLAHACERAMKLPARPPGLPEGALEGVPDAPGVYSFFGDSDRLLYVGRSASLRARVMEHFSAGGRDGREAGLARQVRRVEWEETAGEFAASLREADLLRARRPLHARPAVGGEEVFGLRLVPQRKRAPIFERVPLHATDPAAWEAVHGTFRTRKEADSLLRELAQLYQLCPRRLGLEGGSGACGAHEARRCAGVCAGKESIAAHDARLAGALESVALRAWPWAGAVVIEERCAHSGREAFHVVDHWCHLGSADSAEALAALLGNLPARRFDLDTYRMLVRWFAAEANLAAVRPIETLG